MFGRTKQPTEAAPAPTDTPLKGDGKGRPTPKRREAEQANRRPLVGSTASAKAASALSQAKTREERKAARAMKREADRAAQLRYRQGLISGNEADLGPRDKGPVRRFARDYVDSRRWTAEWAMPAGLVLLVVGLFAPPQLRIYSTILLYVLIVIVLFDIGRVRSNLRRELNARFGDKVQKADITYGMMRSLSMRRFRLPKPQVQRGQHPS